jgi:hypothetical protein
MCCGMNVPLLTQKRRPHHLTRKGLDCHQRGALAPPCFHLSAALRCPWWTPAMPAALEAAQVHARQPPPPPPTPPSTPPPHQRLVHQVDGYEALAGQGTSGPLPVEQVSRLLVWDATCEVLACVGSITQGGGFAVHADAAQQPRRRRWGDAGRCQRRAGEHGSPLPQCPARGEQVWHSRTAACSFSHACDNAHGRLRLAYLDLTGGGSSVAAPEMLENQSWVNSQSMTPFTVLYGARPSVESTGAWAA